MKKKFLVLLTGLMIITGAIVSYAQEEPIPKKDTVNIDTDAKPTFYYAVEDEGTEGAGNKSGSGATLAIIGGVVVIAAGIGFFLFKKKK